MWWTIGVDNLFNVHPNTIEIKGSVNLTATAHLVTANQGAPFEGVQMGFNGMRIFTKLTFHF